MRRVRLSDERVAQLEAMAKRAPHMLSCEMRSINRQYVASKPKPKIFELVQDAQSAIDRAQILIVEKPHDPNAALLELSEANGLLETLYSNASMEVLETEIL